MDAVIGQRDKALDAMRSYQEQCDCLRGDLANREQKLEEQMERVSSRAVGGGAFWREVLF